ncbi:MAG: hypothetical protein JWR80_874 [Bradyrhizobium sp.]|nr:hypothetical protein [Bradyrhizobium sp.]
MELLAGDWEPPIVKGRGEILFVSLRRFEYTLTGMPEDPLYTDRQLQRQRDNNYDGLRRFRLRGVAADATDYMAGWTIPAVSIGPEAWTFSGTCEGLFTDDTAIAPSENGATEAQFVIPREHPAWYFLEHFVTTARSDGGVDPEFALALDGATVRFHFDHQANLLTISTPGSTLLPLTLTEDWLGEPLRILFGQLAFPRLVARSFPKGGAMIRVSRSPAWYRDSNWAGLWKDTDLDGRDRFWRLYAALLNHIARAGAFERHKITTLYEEVIQASRGSRWLWALTFASSIEGVIRMIAPRGSRRGDADDDAIAAISAHIEAWTDTDPARKKDVAAQLRRTAIGAVQRSREASPRYVLNHLRKGGAVTSFQIAAWERIRNEVMHGNLVSPYSSQEDDALLLALAGLLHALTQEVVSPSVALA